MEYTELFSHQLYGNLEEILNSYIHSIIFPEEYTINKIRKYSKILNSTTRLNTNFLKCFIRHDIVLQCLIVLTIILKAVLCICKLQVVQLEWVLILWSPKRSWKLAFAFRMHYSICTEYLCHSYNKIHMFQFFINWNFL